VLRVIVGEIGVLDSSFLDSKIGFNMTVLATIIESTELDSLGVLFDFDLRCGKGGVGPGLNTMSSKSVPFARHLSRKYKGVFMVIRNHPAPSSTSEKHVEESKERLNVGNILSSEMFRVKWTWFKAKKVRNSYSDSEVFFVQTIVIYKVKVKNRINETCV
jgi:hypothetical protein